MHLPTLPVSAGGECFLCAPPLDLVFRTSENFIALAGLGPVVDGYCLVAAKSHARSMADIPPKFKAERAKFVHDLRHDLTSKFGSCLITEHGRMAVCTSDEHDHHCFHAHFLFFPGAPDISAAATSYFLTANNFDSLEDALKEGALLDEYFLLSSSPDRYVVFAKPNHAPRQLARFLVASQLGAMEKADWKLNPNREAALKIAQSMRA